MIMEEAANPVISLKEVMVPVKTGMIHMPEVKVSQDKAMVINTGNSQDMITGLSRLQVVAIMAQVLLGVLGDMEVPVLKILIMVLPVSFPILLRPEIKIIIHSTTPFKKKNPGIKSFYFLLSEQCYCS